MSDSLCCMACGGVESHAPSCPDVGHSMEESHLRWTERNRAPLVTVTSCAPGLGVEVAPGSDNPADLCREFGFDRLTSEHIRATRCVRVAAWRGPHQAVADISERLLCERKPIEVLRTACQHLARQLMIAAGPGEQPQAANVAISSGCRFCGGVGAAGLTEYTMQIWDDAAGERFAKFHACQAERCRTLAAKDIGDARMDVERRKKTREMAYLKHGPGGRGGPGPCDAHCRKCELDREVLALVAPADLRERMCLPPALPPGPAIRVHNANSPGAVDRALNTAAGNESVLRVLRANAAPQRLCNHALYPAATVTTPREQQLQIAIASPPIEYKVEILWSEGGPPSAPDPLDVEYDGAKLRILLERDRRHRNEVPQPPGRDKDTRWLPLTPAQRAAVSAHWSAELRAKVAAAAEAERQRVRVDLEDE